jgi:hypothetical protein
LQGFNFSAKVLPCSLGVQVYVISLIYTCL